MDQFYTLKGYQLNQESGLTYAMEDYLEMICRMFADRQSVKVGDLAKKLHVKPSSASKMIQHLNALGYIHAPKYGVIELTGKGQAAGNYLLYRHDVLHRFLRLLNKSEDELEQVEKIEHFLNRTTIENLDALTKKM